MSSPACQAISQRKGILKLHSRHQYYFPQKTVTTDKTSFIKPNDANLKTEFPSPSELHREYTQYSARSSTVAASTAAAAAAAVTEQLNVTRNYHSSEDSKRENSLLYLLRWDFQR